MVRIIIIGALVLFLSGCNWFVRPEPTRVNVPIATSISIPEELEKPYTIVNKPTFVEPNDPNAVTALTEKGVEDFQLMTNSLLNRIRLWESYYIIIEEN